jgi:hypothetical protein
MGIATFPAPSAASKTMYRTTLTSGTSWTVPAGVTYVNVTLYGGGGGGGNGGGNTGQTALDGKPGQQISSIVNTTPGSSISYAIGAGGPNNSGTLGGTTTFTGATSATGGACGSSGNNSQGSAVGTSAAGGNNNGGGGGGNFIGGNTGGAGKIDIEYWV